MLKRFYSVISKNTKWLGVFTIAVLLCLFLVKAHFDVEKFIVPGSQFVDKTSPLRSPDLLTRPYGYDGQFYYRLSLDPFTNQKTKYGISLDQPSLRHQRIMYPLTAWTLSLGNPIRVPYMLFTINALLFFGLFFLSLQLIKDAHRHSVYSFAFLLYPAFLITLSRDLTEIFSSFFLIAAYILLSKNKYFFASIFSLVAVLTRETTLIFPAIIFIYYLVLYLRGMEKVNLRKAAMFSLPLIAFGFWQIILYKVWGQIPLFLGNTLNIGLPFIGMRYLFYFKTLETQLRIIEVLYLLFIVLLAAREFYKSTEAIIKYVWLAYAIIPIFYSQWLWTEDWTFFRAFTELYLFSFILIIKGDSKFSHNFVAVTTLSMACLILLKILL